MTVAGSALLPTSDTPGARLERVYSEAATAMARALQQMWPDGPSVLGSTIPSLTNVVRLAATPEGEVVAKYLCSEPLASVLGRSSPSRPGCPADGPGLRTERQARQLWELRRLGIPTCGPVYTTGRVLVSRRVDGTTLAEMLQAHPHNAGELLAATWAAVVEVHRAYRVETDECLALAEPYGTIPAAFHTFYRNAEARISNQLGVGWFGPAELPRFRHRLARLVRVIRRLSDGGEDQAAVDESGLAYGQLTPEHVLLDPAAAWPVLCSPRLQLASPAADAAMLLSRSAITLLAGPPIDHSQAVASDIEAFLQSLVDAPRLTTPNEWLRRLLVLWLMDTLTVIGTYLVLEPHGSPLPAHLASVRRWVPAAMTVLEAVVDQLARRRPVAAARQGLHALPAVAGRHTGT